MHLRKYLLIVSITVLGLLSTGALAMLATLPAPVAVAASWQTSPASGPQENAPVESFGVVDGGILYRSAQPNMWDMLWVQHYGIRSIVNLREEQFDDGQGTLMALGFTSYLHLPIADHTPPTEAQALEFLQFVQDQRNWPVLVHCAVGKGRTGTLVALTRYAVDGWSMEQALAEADRYTGDNALQPIQRDWLAAWAREHAPGAQRITVSHEQE